MAKDGINQYTCDTCHKTITMVDRDTGVTPFYLTCRAIPHCRGMMRSSMYRVAQSLKPNHEWYKPTTKVNREFRDYVKQGGLLIRKIEASS